MVEQRFIGLDWGTSSLRAYLFAADGRVLARREAPWGIMTLPPLAEDGAPARSGGDETNRERRFSHAFWQLLGDWLGHPGTSRRVVACGMIGSSQGWREASYMPVPVTVRDLAGSLTTIEVGQGVTLAIAPGIIEHGALPNVLRGEETQIAGVPALLAEAGTDMSGRWLLGLPGTHSKWVAVRDGEIGHFDTFMTGEVYALLVQHSILGRSMGSAVLPEDSRDARDTFLLGLGNACSESGKLGVLATMFSSRVLGLVSRLTGAQQREYLSGLLIGHEIAGLLARVQVEWRQAHIALIGRAALCARYAEALRYFGREALILSEDAGVHGLWSLISSDCGCDALQGCEK
ncbi:MAG TPA: 2-dehydro-3-deoxygalactonokinase [Burkholderiaceae bacterium]|nr:2-dehydro-3-deoxygalactonokinase [Burkholderiaceae bacterium]